MSFLFAALILAASSTTTPPAPTTTPASPVRGGHELSASFGSLSYGGFFRAGAGVLAIELGYHRGLFAHLPEDAAVRVGGGLRFGIPNRPGPISGPFFPVEAFVQAQLRARIGIWEPLVGPELGVSGLTAIGWTREGLPEDLYELEQQRISPFFVGVTLAPFRIRWSRMTLSVLELSLGTTLSPLGAARRTRFSFVSLGAVL